MQRRFLFKRRDVREYFRKKRRRGAKQLGAGQKARAFARRLATLCQTLKMN